jgi:hypothetical protein
MEVPVMISMQIEQDHFENSLDEAKRCSWRLTDAAQ